MHTTKFIFITAASLFLAIMAPTAASSTPFGVIERNDPHKELSFSGVYRLTSQGKLHLLEDGIKAPDGIAFAPDERTPYLTDVDPQRMAWLAYNVVDDGSIRDGRMFFSAMRWKGERAGAADGIKVDAGGNLYGAGPEGVYIFASDGTHLGTVFTGVPTGNLAWGEDGSTLFVTANTRVLKLRVLTSGYPWSMTANNPRRTDPARRQ